MLKEALTGAVEKKFHKESLNGTFKFLECYNDRPHMKRRHMEVFTIIAKCRTRFSKKFASQTFHNKTAEICQSYTKRFPILFPEYSITRKMHVLSIVAPKQIREQKLVYKILKLVEAGENLHCKLNKLERQYVNITNKSDRMFYMMQEYETSLYIK